MAAAYEAAGIGLDLIGHALERRWITFDRIEDLYRDSGREVAPNGRRVSRVARASADTSLAPLLAALGLPSPDDDELLAGRDERLLTAFIGAWDVGSDARMSVRARRAARSGKRCGAPSDGWLELFAEQVTRPLEDQDADGRRDGRRS